MKKKLMTIFFGLVTGFINGLLGAGGGMLAVPALQKIGLEEKDSHRNAVAVILPMTILSAALYLANGRVAISDAFPFVPWGVLGAILGTFFLKKISGRWLGVIFGGFMIWAGVRMIMR